MTRARRNSVFCWPLYADVGMFDATEDNCVLLYDTQQKEQIVLGVGPVTHKNNVCTMLSHRICHFNSSIGHPFTRIPSIFFIHTLTNPPTILLQNMLSNRFNITPLSNPV